MEWAIEECLKTSLPVGASMCIGPEGDMHGVTAAECAVRMARAGAHIGERETVRKKIEKKTIFQLASTVTLTRSSRWSACAR